jgi:dTDP-4-amino-4,6-dideoxygalactose transaminase
LVDGQLLFHAVLRSKGIPAFGWDGVIHPQLALEEFPDASFLYQNLVLLPIHQSLGDAELKIVIRVLREALEEGGRS